MVKTLVVVFSALAETGDSGGDTIGIIMVPMVLTLIVAAYVLNCWLLFRVGKKMGYEKCWMAWVPIFQWYMLCDLAGKDTSYFLLMLLTIFCGCWIGMIMLAAAWMELAGRMSRSNWWGVLTFIPIIGFIGMYIIGNGELLVFAQQPGGYALASGQYSPPPGPPPPPPPSYGSPPGPPPPPDQT